MIIQGNKRVSQLIQLTSNEVEGDDLLLIIDVTARESKNIQLSQLSEWLNNSGSIEFAQFADTASYVLGSNVSGPVLSASYAYTASVALATNSVSASYAITSSYSNSSSFATTASFALTSNAALSNTSSYLKYSGFPNGTASYALNANTANVASASSNLLYFGGNNGTASYAINTQNVQHAVIADTASYFNSTITNVASASYAYFAETGQSGMSDSSSFLIFSPNNGTASYAMAAKTFGNVIVGQGVFFADTQSLVQAQLDDIDVYWSTQNLARTPIEAYGTIRIPFTSSSETLASISLVVQDRNTGLKNTLDSTPVSFRLSPVVDTWSTFSSGSVKQTFSLIGQPTLYGSYLVFVTGSSNIEIDAARAVRFNISTESDTFSEYSNTPIGFSSVPSVNFQFTSNVGGPFTDTAVNIQQSASLGNSIYTISGINNAVQSISYFWNLTQVTASNFSSNLFLTSISGVPNSLTYLSCSNCAITSFYTFISTSLNIFNFNNNKVTTFPILPYSMSYVDCSFNQLTSLNLPVSLSYLNCQNNNISMLPLVFPQGLQTFIADGNTIMSVTSTFPTTLITMSLNNNSSLNYISNFPTSLEYLSVNHCFLNNLPTLPTELTYLYAQSCSLFQASIDTITSTLVANAVDSGSIDVRGNGLLSPTSLANMTTLSSNAWTTLYDT